MGTRFFLIHRVVFIYKFHCTCIFTSIQELEEKRRQEYVLCTPIVYTVVQNVFTLQNIPIFNLKHP